MACLHILECPSSPFSQIFADTALIFFWMSLSFGVGVAVFWNSPTHSLLLAPPQSPGPTGQQVHWSLCSQHSLLINPGFQGRASRGTHYALRASSQKQPMANGLSFSGWPPPKPPVPISHKQSGVSPLRVPCSLLGALCLHKLVYKTPWICFHLKTVWVLFFFLAFLLSPLRYFCPFLNLKSYKAHYYPKLTIIP